MKSQWRICQSTPSFLGSDLADVAQRCSAAMELVFCENQQGCAAVLVPMAPLLKQSFSSIQFASDQTESDSTEDQILFLPSAETVGDADQLIALARQIDSLRSAPIWLAVPPKWATDDVHPKLVALDEVAGQLEIDTERGRNRVFDLHAPVQISRVQQLKELGLGREVPEGSGDNLSRREGWFRGRTGC